MALGLSGAAAPRVETLNATAALPAHIAAAFAAPLNFQQTDRGEYFVFDRRAHAVYTVADDEAKPLVQIGAEPGRLLDPSAFDMAPGDGSFVVADAPGRQERIQTFTVSGGRIGGFFLPGREVPRLIIDATVLNGIGSVQFDGRTVLLNQPERGALFTEMAIDGTPLRTFGLPRPTGHEEDPNVHLALNAGLPLIDPTGGYYFVFQAGVPLLRKYSTEGTLLFERHIEGPEVDEYLRTMPTRWLTHRTEDGDVLPLVPPAIRTAAVDRAGRLWVALRQGIVYVFDPAGDKTHTVRLRAATGPIVPSSLFFTGDGRILVTPGCYEFRIPAAW